MKLTLEDAKTIIRARIISRIGPEALAKMTKSQLNALTRFAIRHGIPKHQLD